MPLPGYRAADVRAAEEPLLAAGEPLMAIAARGVELAVVAALREARGAVAGTRVVVLVGSGNNGGDGLFAAAGLARRGVAVRVLITSAAPHPDGLAAALATQARVEHLAGRPEDEVGEVVARTCARADVVVDAIAGTGITGALRGVAAAAVRGAMDGVDRARSRPVVAAVDVPSGIGVDDGDVPGDVLPADITLTMGCAKAGLLLPPACHLAGRIDVVDLGLDLTRVTPPTLRLNAADAAAAWPVPGPSDHKYTRGVLGVLAGSDAYPGAAVLATAAAVPLAGMVRYLGPPDATRYVLTASPEVVPGRGRVQAWALGSGIGAGDVARLGELAIVLREATGKVPVVLDAGGLEALPERVPASVVLTPHAGELARLLTARGQATSREQVEAAPVDAVRLAVSVTGATVLLKGSTSLIAGPGTPVYSQADATPWLATAGAGDVLAGILGALLAGRSAEVMTDPALAARIASAAAVVHGLAARRAAGGAGETDGGGQGDRGGGPIRALQVAASAAAVLRSV